ncbi:MAG TPA: deoxyribodipyrimidine photo-lyase [Candidatus Hydrogenedentes bacterium]|jgi:deoxyribodipyrimidine photo-lyase|nr:deoxyribodipyrimidine photo-lyase [Candidatus Hydrogenedentota bacterium]MDY0030844.1 deoxyribodipyrimidine photo-lyase [FCB group bacterium]NLT60608.1 deoxyribodipyrimidine photo-lyase [Candidatus Hydrogenedentota bacterium]HNZ19134.1 deoxyribodipyrimidine photo-lyase [Candidatus Hydrogenedentota bacterium]HOH32515.1 deoxyribodipyrimidine photo-lyase [Candidatus Hydrogenedentota bacterium]
MAHDATIVWFRQDLRLEDNPAFSEAVRRGGLVIPVYVWAPAEEGDWAPGAASRCWLHHSLERLERRLEKAGSRLIIRRGAAWDELESIARSTGAGALYWNRRYEPEIHRRDETVRECANGLGLAVKDFNGSLLVEPWEVTTRQGGPYKVFTPFWKAALDRLAPAEPVTAPRRVPAPESWPKSLRVDSLGLAPRPDWADGIRDAWAFGEDAAWARLEAFLDASLDAYCDGRDQPARDDTSRLSPYLHFGEIGPRQVWHAVQAAAAGRGSKAAERGAEKFLSELGWREFSYNLLYNFPHLPVRPMQEKFAAFPWKHDAETERAWQRGRTGYPIVDAGMRQLWNTGWMHNRVRMIVASMLTKDLLIPWQHGAAWFWDTLVDADLANNTQGWQWTAGCGADAAPYFRIFNPVTQGERYDPAGEYIREWVPELARLPGRWIHKPWQAPRDTLRDAGVCLDDTYPSPIIDHSEARDRALAAYERIK